MVTGPSVGPGDGFDAGALGDAYRKAGAQIGRINIAVFGKTGVGKSTLVNAIFGESVAATGIGSPVTKGSHLYLHRAGHVGIVDNEGLEIGKDTEAILGDLGQFIAMSRSLPLADQLHVAWYCVHAGSRRFEPVEAEFIRRLRGLGIPVLVVLTQVPATPRGIHPDALALAGLVQGLNLPLAEPKVILTAALGDEYQGLQAFGLEDLLDATFRVAPEGVELALAAAQQVSFGHKDRAAKKAISTAVTMAAGTGATPIPFSDAALLVPLQLGLITRIAHIYGLDLQATTAAALVATTAATGVGRSVVGGLLKMVPGVGTVVGAGISATVAGTLTYAMGVAWQAVCVRVARGELDPGALTDKRRIGGLFLEEFRRAASVKQIRSLPRVGPRSLPPGSAGTPTD